MNESEPPKKNNDPKEPFTIGLPRRRKHERSPYVGPPPKIGRDVVKQVPEGGMVGPVPDSTPPPKEK